jgi:hypothetical protein
VGLGADNVGREHAPESMIVGQKRSIIASRALFHCEPLQVGWMGRSQENDQVVFVGREQDDGVAVQFVLKPTISLTRKINRLESG